jgi:hypothetical protein
MAIERRIHTNYESRSWINRGDFGDYHRGCDIRDDAVLDPVSVVDGISVVARAARARLNQLHRDPSDEPEPADHSERNRN